MNKKFTIKEFIFYATDMIDKRYKEGYLTLDESLKLMSMLMRLFNLVSRHIEGISAEQEYLVLQTLTSNQHGEDEIL